MGWIYSYYWFILNTYFECRFIQSCNKHIKINYYALLVCCSNPTGFCFCFRDHGSSACFFCFICFGFCFRNFLTELMFSATVKSKTRSFRNYFIEIFMVLIIPRPIPLTFIFHICFRYETYVASILYTSDSFTETWRCLPNFAAYNYFYFWHQLRYQRLSRIPFYLQNM